MTLFLDSCDKLCQEIRQERYCDQNNPEFQLLGQRIISCLDTSQLPDYAREYFDAEAAVCLEEVLDRTRLPPAEAIPEIESVETKDGAESLLRWQPADPRDRLSLIFGFAMTYDGHLAIAMPGIIADQLPLKIKVPATIDTVSRAVLKDGVYSPVHVDWNTVNR